MKLFKEYLHTDYIILTIIFFLASIKGGAEATIVESFSMPFYVSVFQNFSNVIIISLMLFTVLKKIIINKNAFNNITSKKLIFSFGIFQLLLVIVTQETGWLIKIISVIIIIAYFVLFISNAHFYDFQHPNRLTTVYNSMLIGIWGFILYNLVLFLIIPDLTTFKGRFYGATAHPNFIGIIGSLSSIITIHKILLLKKTSIFKKILPIIFLIFSIYIIILSDSRTSILMTLVYIGVVFFKKIKKLENKIILVLIGLPLVFFIFNFIFLPNFDSNSLGERGFNRDTTWTELWNNAKEPTFFGLGKYGATANSYLFVIVATGIFGGFFFYYTIIGLVKLLGKRKNVLGIFYDACLITILVGAILEGFFLDTLSIPILVVWTLISIKTMKIRNRKITNQSNYYL